jgi:integrating conjugative element protein (TIGR03761 family)
MMTNTFLLIPENDITTPPTTEAEQNTSSRMMGSFKTTLHTELAQKLATGGKWKFGEMGLRQFLSATANIWKAFHEDDPYAHWYLFKIYNAIDETKKQTKVYEKMLEEQFSNLRGIDIEVFHHETPLQLSLNFTPPFTFIITEMLEHIDFLMRQLITLRRMCLVPPEKLYPGVLKNKTQHIFALPRRWHNTGVTRQDIRDNTQKAQQAASIMKEPVPLPILNKEIHLPFLPKLN